MIYRCRDSDGHGRPGARDTGLPCCPDPRETPGYRLLLSRRFLPQVIALNPRKTALLLVVACAAWAEPAARALGGESSDSITAVSSKTSPDYVRLRQKDGTFPVDPYAFGDGGHFGGPMIDQSIDKLKFIDVARVISVPLAEQNYLPERDPRKTRLLIMVYWGLTGTPQTVGSSVSFSNLSSIQSKIAASAGVANAAAAGAGKSSGFHSSNSNNGASDWQLAEMSSAVTVMNIMNQQRAQTDFYNASMLGYDSEGVIGTEYGLYVRGTPLAVRRDELVGEIEENRYFVVLMAYDFQLMWKQKKHKLLWETRFSIRQRHNNFDQDLAGMARVASQYFGQNTRGLVRKDIPLGDVEIGKVQSLGTVEK
jgi:hypothetical protein